MVEKKRMFVRFWKKKQVEATVHSLKVQFNPKIEMDKHGLIQVFAPDGDVVLAAMPKDERGNYIVRLSPEVFNETPEDQQGDADGQK